MKIERTLACVIAIMMTTISFFAMIGGTNTAADDSAVPPDAARLSDPSTGWNVLLDDEPIGLSAFIYERWGGWWSDAEKIPGDDGAMNPEPYLVGESDDLLCWAATTANMLEYTGWGFVDGMDTPDEMLDYFEVHVTDEGSKIWYGLSFWGFGFLYDPGDGWATSDGVGGNFWPTDMISYMTYEDDTAHSMKDIEQNLASNRACGIEIDEVSGGGEHAITVWGVTIDDTIEDIDNAARYKGIWLTDPDDGKGNASSEDFLRYFNVSWSPENNFWYMPNYGGGWSIESV
ncbi:MAG TPA: hypothetical protein VLH13_01840, partial [Methanomassiliicoccales archaeon]|nr:hypothetical protein [Methanomassiliicoccales archaeon]